MGDSFGPSPQIQPQVLIRPRVLIGGNPCNVMFSNQSQIQCIAARGHSISNQVLVLQSFGGLGFSGKLTVSYTQCSVGFYQDSIQFLCNPCPIGTYSAYSGSTACLSCPVGTIAPMTNQSSCQLCRAGTIYSNNACASCPIGTSSTSGASVCSTCTAPAYQAMAGSSSCDVCPAGSTYQSATSCQVWYVCMKLFCV